MAVGQQACPGKCKSRLRPNTPHKVVWCRKHVHILTAKRPQMPANLLQTLANCRKSHKVVVLMIKASNGVHWNVGKCWTAVACFDKRAGCIKFVCPCKASFKGGNNNVCSGGQRSRNGELPHIGHCVTITAMVNDLQLLESIEGTPRT